MCVPSPIDAPHRARHPHLCDAPRSPNCPWVLWSCKWWDDPCLMRVWCALPHSISQPDRTRCGFPPRATGVGLFVSSRLNSFNAPKKQLRTNGHWGPLQKYLQFGLVNPELRPGIAGVCKHAEFLPCSVRGEGAGGVAKPAPLPALFLASEQSSL